jgi:pimeloyl-ACP methyl ester carboxylesterase
MPQARANGITLEYDVHGPASGEPLLLIMGLGAQMTRWPVPFIELLAAQGLKVIRFDNRDVGLSERIESGGVPDLTKVIGALMQGQKPDVPYLLDDMAADAVGLLDALGLARAHIVGASLGGMVAQLVAADYPHRVLSLTSILSTTGNRELPPAKPEAMAVLNDRGPDPLVDLDGYLAHSLKGARVIGSPGYPQSEESLRESTLASFKRSYYPVGFARQYAAAAASPDRRPKLAGITAPTVVIHGGDDALVPVEGGRDTAANIKGSELRIVPGMGHDFPPELYGEIADGILRAVERSKTSA